MSDSSGQGESPPSTKSRAKPRPPFHPLLFAVFPILSVYFHNAGYVPARELPLPLLLSLSITCVLYFGLTRLIKDLERTALIVSGVLLLFFCYGPIFAQFQSNEALEASTGNEWLWLLGWAAIAVALVVFFTRSRGNFSSLTRILNGMSIVMVLLPVASSLFGRASASEIADESWREGGEDAPENRIRDFVRSNRSRPADPSAPDIFYIILDGYGRADVLKEMYDFDNSPFIGELESLGFIIASRSRSNYIHTFESIESAMNFEYLQQFRRTMNPEIPQLEAAQRTDLRNAQLIRFLKDRGYSVMSFATGYFPTDLIDADLYLIPPVNASEFDTALIEMTPLSGLFRVLFRNSDIAFDLHRSRINFMLDRLADPTSDPGPTFVFAHVLSPHAPFVFGPDGEARRPKGVFTLGEGNVLIKTESARAEYRRLYRDQVKGLNTKVLRAVKDILEKSPQPPIIVIHGDHGPGSELNWSDADQTNLKERFAIFNAIYLPDGEHEGYYDTITPVNIFRFVLNSYLGTDLEYLEDRNYFSPWHFPYAFLDVTERVGAD